RMVITWTSGSGCSNRTSSPQRCRSRRTISSWALVPKKSGRWAMRGIAVLERPCVRHCLAGDWRGDRPMFSRPINKTSLILYTSYSLDAVLLAFEPQFSIPLGRHVPISRHPLNDTYYRGCRYFEAFSKFFDLHSLFAHCYDFCISRKNFVGEGLSFTDFCHC